MRRILWVLLAAVMVLGLSPARSLAQGGIQDLVGKNDLNAAEKAAVKQHVERAVPGLTKEIKDPADALEIKKARDLLLKPLQDAKTVSLAFRREFSGELLALLQSLAKDKNDLKASNALIIAGELATQSVVDILLNGLKDSRSSVRYAAAYGLARLFDACGKHDPAVTPDKLLAIVTALSEQFRKEADPRVCDGVALAFESALTLTAEKLNNPTFAPATLSAVAKALTDRLKALPTEDKPTDKLVVCLRVVAMVRNAATLGAQQVGPEEKKNILAMCAQVAATVTELRKLKDLTPAAKAHLDQLGAAAQSLEALLK